ncbi:MAG: NADH-quinone oxidoreductase subunit NuoF [Thermodesulfobacteriota bacterium]
MPRLSVEDLRRKREEAASGVPSGADARKGKIVVHMGTCGIAAGAREVLSAFRGEVEKDGEAGILLFASGCAGLCSKEPTATVELPGAPPVLYGELTAEKAKEIFVRHLQGGEIVPTHVVGTGPGWEDVPFFAKQLIVVLKNRGVIDPKRIDDYIARGGYAALAEALMGMTPEEVVEEIIASGLRGRGGAGFPTGRKWKICRAEEKTPKYIIGNCDEGDPGAYMDRSLLESDPHSVIEGMTIAAYAVGASKGFVYVRTEYPLAIENLRHAVTQARDHGLLGEGILGAGFDFDIEIREGSGAFVCGEETSLIHSIEGVSPEPGQRPPFPAQAGLWGCPTVINNVETLANVPEVLRGGADWFSGIGTSASKGTKIFSLVGRITNTGLIEVPMGISLREIIYEIGGGIPGNKKLKAVQTGGPSGGCIPSDLIDLPVDYESLKEAGSMMGSGGMIVMDENTCMVDIAKYFIQFTNDESCGKCTTCREGSEALLEILTRISEGEGREGDIELLEEFSLAIKDASMCGLGMSLPNPVLSTLRYFRKEYEEHIKYKRCPAVVCRGIISSPCQYKCPLKTDVPAYLTLIAKGRFEEALEVVRRTNPLSVICGRVCMAHCEANCRTRETGEPLAVKNLKQFLVNWEIGSGKGLKGAPPPHKKYDENVAVIGSGPAGLTAGYYLAQKGYGVTIFEKLPVLGGMLAVGIPDYRLPKHLLQMEIDFIAKAGVNIETNSPIENIDTLFKKGYKAVLIAVGAHRNRRLEIPGEDADGVIDPVAYLRQTNLREKVPSLGDRVGIVGGGNTAVDVARTAIRKGAKEVIILYRRTRAEMPAIEEEIEAALEEGVRIEYLVAPTEVISADGRLKAIKLVQMRLGERDASGRRRPVPIEGSEFLMELDSLLPAISQDPDLSFLSQGDGIDISRAHTVRVDEDTFMTGKKGVFACGDAVTGPADVTTAMAAAEVVAESIHKYLRGEVLKREYRPVRPSVVVEPIKQEEEMGPVSRPKMPKLSPERRRSNFDEVELGYSKEMAMEEAKRCLRCDWEMQKLRRQREAQDITVGNDQPFRK